MNYAATLQKFHHGDWVQISADLGSSMSHFKAGVDAIVLGSYADQYGGRDVDSYNLYVHGQGSTSWYRTEQLTLIESGREDKLQEWKEAAEIENKVRGDLDWIFNHGVEVLENGYSPSVVALARAMGVNDLWGSQSEGIVYYQNMLTVLKIAEPFLRLGDKEGFIVYLQKAKKV